MDTLSTRDLLKKNWYYSIELEPGVFTQGHEHANISVTRATLRRADFGGTRCLDIGTQEAVVPILLKRAGAGEVVAYDRMDLSDKVQPLQERYQSKFRYVAGMPLTELPGLLGPADHTLFDVVVFSGVMYHMINPFGGLILARRFCREGGLFLIETVAVNAPEELFHFNARGQRFGKHGNYFIPTTGCLDYLLRMIGLKPELVCYTGKPESASAIRLAVLCRSEARPCPAADDDRWPLEDFHNRAYAPECGFNWQDIRHGGAPVEHSGGGDGVVPVNNHSLFDCVLGASPRRFEEEELRLTLDATL